MPFLSEADIQRLAPSVMCFIPRVLWKSIPIYNKSISYEELAIITNDLLPIDYPLEAINPLMGAGV